MKKKQEITMDEAVATLNQIGEDWTGNNAKESIFTVCIRAARKLSRDPLFNAAAYLMYSYGGLYTGEEEEGWIQSAKDVKKILGV